MSEVTVLGKVAQVILGQSPSASSINLDGVGIPFLQGNAEFSDLHPAHIKYCSAPTRTCCENDILLSVRAPVGETNKADKAYAIGRGLAAVRFDGASHSFGWHALRFWSPNLELVAQGSTFSAVGRAEIEGLRLRVFSPAEQTRIAEILDTLDGAIREAEGVVGKLRQVKAGLLHDLLTRGLNEHGQLRDPARHPDQFQDSPLGRIPKAWGTRLLCQLAEVSSGVTLGREIKGNAVELPYLRVANVQDGYLDLSEIKTVRVMPSEVDRFQLRPGDVLMNEGGDFDKLGRGAVWRGEIECCLHQNHVFKVRPAPALLLPDFLAAVSASHIGKRYFLLSSKQSTNLASMNSTQLNAFPVPCPHISEQQAIIVSMQTADHRLQAEQEHLGKLRELKRGLSHDLLTGRVRVKV